MRRRRTAAMLGGGIALIVAGVVWAVAEAQTADVVRPVGERPRVQRPRTSAGLHRRGALQRAHRLGHLRAVCGAAAPRRVLGAAQRRAALVVGARRDSFVDRFGGRVILVVSNALGWRGTLQQS